MEPNAAIFEHVTKMGRIGIPTAHQSEPVYRQPSYDFDDLTDTPVSTDRSKIKPTDREEVYVDMKLGRNMRARPRRTNDGRSNGQTSDKLDCAVTDPLLPLTANSSTSAAVEFFCHMHSRMPDLGTSNISYLTNNSSSLSRTIASPQHPTQDLIETLNRQKQTRRQLEVEKEHHQAKAETKRWKTEDSLHRIDSPSDQKEQTSAKVPPLDTESQSDLTKSKNVGYTHDRGVRTEKDNDEDDDFVLEKNDSSKEDSDINDF